MSGYTEVFVVPVPKKSIKSYRKHAEDYVKVWCEHGALSVAEVEADDVKPGKLTSFPQSVDLKPDETVFVGIATYKSRKHRDDVTAKAMKDPRMSGMDPKSMPFDAKRMFWGGFKPFVGEGPSASAHASIAQPYLFFRGRCEEAIAYYRDKVGAEVIMMMRFKDHAREASEPAVAPELAERIMHAEVKIGGAVIMMSDGLKTGDLDFQSMSVALTVSDRAESDRIFNVLAKDGRVQTPMAKTFFASQFGAVADRFGVSWMIVVP